MYEHVLVAVDGSPVSLRAVAEGARLVRMSGGELHVITIIDRPLAHLPYYAKYYDAASALELRQLFISYDRTLLIADPRRCEPKKFGGRGARARRQKSYR